MGGTTAADTTNWYDVSQGFVKDLEPAPIPHDLLHQAGYSSAADNSTFLRLQEGVVDQSALGAPSPQSRVKQTQQALLVALLPSHQLTMMLVDLYFDAVTWEFPPIDEHHFRARYDQWRSAYHKDGRNGLALDLQFFPALLFQVLAQTVDCLSPEHPAAQALHLEDYKACDHLAYVFHAAGDKIVQIVGRQRPTVSSIEQDLLAAIWLKNSGRGSDTWNRLGSAVRYVLTQSKRLELTDTSARQAQELGIHSLPATLDYGHGGNIGSDLLAFWDLEHRRRLWTRLFIIDA